MGKFVVVVVALAILINGLATTFAQSAQSCGEMNGYMTSGGTVSPLYYPWAVSITDKDGKPFCGGALISYNSILTAGHCVGEKSLGDIKVILGVHDLSQSVASDYYTVTKIDVHPDFTKASDGKGYENDLAILGVDAPQDQPNIQPICIFKGWGTHSWDVRTVIGWGATENGAASQTLQQLSLRLTPVPQCSEIWSKTLDPNKVLCMGKAAKNICTGDDGGPLMVMNDNGFNNELKGVASYWGPECGDKYPGVYVNVEGYKTWIQEHST